MLLHFTLFFCDLFHLYVHLKQEKPQQVSAHKQTPDTETHMLGHYLVNPEDHCVFQVQRKLLRGTEVREALDAGHHLLYADHFHCVRHHESINKVDVGALEEQRFTV